MHKLYSEDEKAAILEKAVDLLEKKSLIKDEAKKEEAKMANNTAKKNGAVKKAPATSEKIYLVIAIFFAVAFLISFSKGCNKEGAPKVAPEVVSQDDVYYPEKLLVLNNYKARPVVVQYRTERGCKSVKIPPRRSFSLYYYTGKAVSFRVDGEYPITIPFSVFSSVDGVMKFSYPID